MAVYIHYDSDLVKNLSQKTNLTPLVVSELLSMGWRYVEKVGEISRWESPMWQLKDKIEEASDPSMYDVLSVPEPNAMAPYATN